MRTSRTIQRDGTISLYAGACHRLNYQTGDPTVFDYIRIHHCSLFRS
jgi:hypothetical protein